jgi:hypothetical protein
MDVTGAARAAAPVEVTSSNPTVASIDALGQLTAHAPGSVVLTARSGETRAETTIEVVANPAAALTLAGPSEARTGDVLLWEVAAVDGDGAPVAD